MENVDKVNTTSVNMQLDITQYLTHDQMRSISEKVFQERISSYVDQILENRTAPNGSITDQILRATVERYVDKLESTFEKDFLRVCKEEIYQDKPGPNKETWEIFRSGISFQLKRVAEIYINNNSADLQSLMKDNIRSQATDMAEDEFTSMIAKKIDIKQLIREVLSESKVERISDVVSSNSHRIVY